MIKRAAGRALLMRSCTKRGFAKYARHATSHAADVSRSPPFLPGNEPLGVVLPLDDPALSNSPLSPQEKCPTPAQRT